MKRPPWWTNYEYDPLVLPLLTHALTMWLCSSSHRKVMSISLFFWTAGLKLAVGQRRQKCLCITCVSLDVKRHSAPPYLGLEKKKKKAREAQGRIEDHRKQDWVYQLRPPSSNQPPANSADDPQYLSGLS